MSSFIRKWGEQVLRSRQYAAGIALIFAFFDVFDVPVVGLVSAVIIALVTLQNGARQGLIIMAWAILPAVAMVYLGDYAIFTERVLLHFLIVWLFASCLRRYHSWASLLQLSTLLGVFAIIAIHYCLPELESWLRDFLVNFIKGIKAPDIITKYVSSLPLGMLTVHILWSNLIALFFARWWQSSLVSTISLQKELYQIRLHYLAPVILSAILLVLGMDRSLSLNMLTVASIPLSLSGLSLLHVYASTKKKGHIILFVFYFLSLILGTIAVLLLSVMACIDSLVNIRRKIVIEPTEQNCPNAQ